MTEEQKMIVGFTKDFAKKFNREYWLSKARIREFPVEMWKELGKSGYIGMMVPTEYGGAGYGLNELRILLQGLAEQGLVTLAFITHPMGQILLVRHGTEEQKRKYLPNMCSGESYFSFAITEADAGTNSYKIKTFAEREGDHYVLNGQKVFISGAKESDHMIVIARTKPYEEVKDIDKRKGFSIFIVDTKAKGLSMDEIEMDLLMIPEKQYTVYFDNVKVPVEDRVGEEDRGFFYLFDLLNVERIVTACTCIGVGKYVLNKAVNYVKERIIFDDPIGAYQAVQHPLARSYVSLELAELVTERAAIAFDNKENPQIVGKYTNIAKLVASESAYKACDVAIQVHGGYGFVTEYDIITCLTWLRTARIAPVNNEMILNFIGQHILGLPKSY